MKYKCLVLDHDDTVVNSTYEIHYPSFIGYLKKARPDFSITFDQYMHENFHPGFQAFCTDTLKLSDKEMEEEVEYWRTYVREHEGRTIRLLHWRCDWGSPRHCHGVV